MASLRFLFGMIPATSKFEAESDKLRSDYQEYKKFEVSEELKHFEHWKKEVTTAEFQQKVKTIKAQNFKQTKNFVKSRNITNCSNPLQLKRILKKKDTEEGKSLSDTSEVKSFLALEAIVKSDKFAQG